MTIPSSIVHIIKLNDEKHVEDFISEFSPLFDHVKTSENSHVSLYDLSQNANDPKILYIFERYVSPDFISNVHEKSQPFLEFQKKLIELPYIASLKTHTMNSIHHTHFDYRKNNFKESLGLLVFAGSRAGKDPETYLAAATSLGEAIARRKKPLIYGGGTNGMMGAVANAVHRNGGKVVSVIPWSLSPRKISGEMIGEIRYVRTMGDRKSTMFSLCDSVVALPGGLGTFDELYEALVNFQLNIFCRKIGILNVNGYFNHFLNNMKHMMEEKFVEKYAWDLIVVENSGDGEALLRKLEQKAMPDNPCAERLNWEMV